MSLPRLFVEITRRSGGGWDVSVYPAQGSDQLTVFAMDATEATVAGHLLRVPVVPHRLPDAADEHYRLSSGDTNAIEDLLNRFATNSPSGADARVYGRWLFQCLLAPAWPWIKKYRVRQGAPGVELALVCPAATTDQVTLVREDLHSLVWEAMHDGKNALASLPDFLVVLTRVVRTGYDAPSTITRVPRVLFATGSELTDEVIRPGAMFMGLVRKFDADGICVTRAVQDVSVLDLQAECESFRPDVVHLVAHGKTLPGGDSVLMLRGDPSGVNAARLLTALRPEGTGPVAVVLSACHSGGGLGPTGPAGPAGAGQGPGQPADAVTSRAAPLAAELVAGGIPIVTAMAGAVSEPACRMFTTRLVDAIHEGRPFGLAAAKGRAAALAGATDSARWLDWAMPTIFLASSVPPGFCPLDPSAVNRLQGISDSLKLRRKPVFIGRQDILSTVDDLFAPGDRRTGFLAVVRDGPLDQLGSTRLLQEIAFRLLRTGHVPLLLAQYSGVGFADVAAGVPADLRTVLEQILQQAVKVADQFGLRPPRLSALAAADPSFAAEPAVKGTNLTALPPPEACQQARMTLRAFAKRTDELADVAIVQYPLAADLGELAGLLTGADGEPGAGDPFGPHTRVVVLADRVHEWTGALKALLAMTGSHGLGRSDKPIPVIVTSSLTEGQGPVLRDFLAENSGSPGYRYHELGRLTREEAAIGFQWVLLNPWHPVQQYRRVYVAARTTRQSVVEQILGVLGGTPASVQDRLYPLIESHTYTGTFVENDDDAAIKAYLGLHP